MSQATIRAAIFAIVDGVSGTGNVYDYLRWAVKYNRILTLAKSASAGTLVMFTLQAGPFTDERIEFRSTGDRGILRTWTFHIRMYYGAKDADATEKTFATLLETVANALNSADSLHDGNTFYDAELASAPIVQLSSFGSDMVHFAQIDQKITEYMT